jgi:hypothetical protein
MHHRLFVSGLVKAEPVGVLLKGLPNPGDIPVSKNAPTARKKRLFFAVPFYILVLHKLNDGLGHRKAFSFH